MSTDIAPTPQTGVAQDVQTGTRVPVSSFVSNLREYGLILALIAIMVFFQLTTGTLFKPVNLSNLVQQNSFIIVMALGMLLVIVSGHIDLSVGSVAGFIGALAAMMMVIWPLGGFFSNPLIVAIICLVIGGAIGAAQGYWIAYHRIPSFIVTLAGMLVFRGLCQGLLGGGSSVGPLPDSFKALSSGFLPEVLGTWTLIPPTINAAGKTVFGSGITLNMTTVVLGVIAVLAYAISGIRARKTREKHGYEAEPFALFVVKTVVISALALFFVYQFAVYRGFPIVLVVMGILVAFFVFITRHTTIGRRVYAMGGNIKAAQLSGIKTERLTLLVFVNMGMLSALGGLIIAARLGQAVPAAGLGSELDVIAAVFIGGASAMGGVGQVISTVVGGFIMGVMNNGMSIMGVNVDWQQVVKGLVLLGAVVFDVYNKNKS
ncbi:multiple monosaccharide ABC transporter permease [Kaistia terrae]|uniref:Xylose transport system permease protein XylH n=1 Tax=Kaistia terrae TaxID=537017 RepID=A0ABW0PT16_9HYPH|nr:multiple monosaccharide ABC transporter permease [Kaistia terrae]MCX5578067.1 sugar ABC transporter permease [Kaistia terrae]